MNCGQSLAGCGAIALAQVLYYYQYPEAVIAPTSTFGIIGYVYRRKNEGGLYYTLIEDLNSREFIWECQETSNSEILEAVYIAGVSIHSKFDFDVIAGKEVGVSNNIFNMEFAIEEIYDYNNVYKIEKCDESTGCCEDGFSCLNSASFEEEIRNEINAKRVVILLAQDQGGKGGHYMVIDSFDNEGRFHINFGWGGNCNNYYYLSDINTFEICGGIDYKFNTNQKAIINIQPKDQDWEANRCRIPWNNEPAAFYSNNIISTKRSLDCPELLVPSPNSYGINNRSYFRWSGVDGAQYYQITIRNRLNTIVYVDSLNIYGGSTIFSDSLILPPFDSIEIQINTVDYEGNVSNCTPFVYYTDTTNCSLIISDYSLICVSDTTYIVDIEIFGIQGHTYDLWAEDTMGVITSLNNISQGNYLLGPLNTNTSIAVVVEDELQPYDCYHGIGIEQPRCVFCSEIELSIITNYCVDGAQSLKINLDADTSTIIDLYTTIEGVNTFNNVGSGDYTFNNIPSGEEFLVIAEDTSKPYDCNRIIYVEGLQCNGDSTETVIQTLEYFIDTDPGYGSGSTIPTPSSYNLIINHAINLDTLSPGVHILYIRAMDELGQWGYTVRKLFYIRPETEGQNRLLTNLEYFIDTDPGLGLGIPLTLENNTNSIDSYLLPLETITPGVHVLYVRGKDNAGNWSFTQRKLFYIRPGSGLSNRLLTNLEYFIDTDPGFGMGSPLTLENDTNSIDSYVLPIDTINPGIHVLYIRGKDNAGNWSYTSRKLFYIRPGDETSNSLLTNLEYFIDTDPGVGMGPPLTLENDTNSIDSYLLPIDTINPGIHVLYVRGKDNAGNWSYTSRKLFYIRPGSETPNRLLTDLEYFIDTDPGFGLGIPLQLDNDTNSIALYDIALDTFTPGLHHLYVRGKDNQGNWGYTIVKPFTIYILGPIVYVDWDATGANIGTSWTNAYNRLEPALMLATLYDTIQEIWIAQGLYKPTSNGDRTISFTWADSTKLYGGFTGTETSRNQRTSDPTLVVLSGDIGISNDSTDNTYHVVVIDSTCQGCYLDRLTIKLGHASGSINSRDKGAGIHSLGNAEIKDVVVEYNSAASTGAAIYNIGSGADLRMMNCIFRFNNSPNGYDVHNADGATIEIQSDVQIED